MLKSDRERFAVRVGEEYWLPVRASEVVNSTSPQCNYSVKWHVPTRDFWETLFSSRDCMNDHIDYHLWHLFFFLDRICRSCRLTWALHSHVPTLGQFYEVASENCCVASQCTLALVFFFAINGATLWRDWHMMQECIRCYPPPTTSHLPPPTTI